MFKALAIIAYCILAGAVAWIGISAEDFDDDGEEPNPYDFR